MKSKLKASKSIVIITAFILSSFLLIGQTNYVLARTNNRASSNQTLPVINFDINAQATNTLSHMIADFNANFSQSYGFTVKLVGNSLGQTTSKHDTYLADFQSQSTAFDVLSMDVTWPAEFASAGYLLPLDNVFNTSYQSQFLQADIATGIYNGHSYSVPWFHNSGMLYYRNDILQYAFTNDIIPANRPPQTWSELTNWTLAMMQNQSLIAKFNLTSGFVWQGASYAGLESDLMEYLGATGTYSFLSANQSGTNTFLSSSQSTTVFKNSSGFQTALRYMKGLITSDVSPKAVLTYREEDSRMVWNAGKSIFMRNWPYAYSLSLESAQLNGSLVTGADHNIQQFNVTAMPVENLSVLNPRTSCLGGFSWQLGVNAYSTHPNEAKEFIMWLTAPEQQTTYFLGTGNLPSLKGVYNNPAILHSKKAYVHNFLPIFESSIPQPVSPNYIQINEDLTPVINNYLGGGITLEAAINNMTTSFKTISNQNPIAGSLNSNFIANMIGVIIIGGMAIYIVIVVYNTRNKKKGLNGKEKKLIEQESGTFTNVSKRICNVCGSKLKSGELFCPNCGNRI